MKQRLQRMELNFEGRLLALAESFNIRASTMKHETEPQAAQGTLETAPNAVGEENCGEPLDRGLARKGSDGRRVNDSRTVLST